MSQLELEAQPNSTSSHDAKTIDQRLNSAIAGFTETALARFDDDAILQQPQDRLIAMIRNAIRKELRQHLPAETASVSAHQLTQVLTMQITGNVRRRQSLAFERLLAREYGPLDPDVDARITEQAVAEGGVTIISTVPLPPDTHTRSA